MSYFDLQISFLFNPCLALSVFVHSFALKWLPFFALLGLSAPQLWTAPAFSESATMTREDLTHPVTAAATTQVKLCPCDEEEPHIWFRIIEAQFAAAGIRSQKLKYANALASLPKQVLRDILDTLDVCNDSDEPLDHLKNTLLGQFGKQMAILF